MRQITFAVIVFGIFLAFSCGFYLVSQDKLRASDEISTLRFDAIVFPTTQTGSGSSRLKPHRTPPPGANEYYDEQYRFALLYPGHLQVTKKDEGGGAATITFQNTESAEGFQVFVVPYAEPSVSDERFRKDVPSGVRTSVAPVTIDGATGAAFYSEHLLLGATAEVWFIRGGYLYEVTTLRDLADWVSGILQTWQFI